jgi:hypothetical protein
MGTSGDANTGPKRFRRTSTHHRPARIGRAIQSRYRDGTDPEMTPRTRTAFLFAGLGFAAFIISALMPVSYDEGIWLVNARRWSAGESLYSDIPENETPALMGVVRAVDAAPGPFTSARAAYLGALIVVLAAATRALTSRLGWTEPKATIAGLIAGVAAATQTVLVINFELPAATLVMLGLAAIASGRGWAGGSLAAAGAAFDIRAFALLPGVALFAYAVGGRERSLRTSAAVASVAGPWALAVILIPDLRFGLLELNATTRTATATWRPLEQIYMLLRGPLFPIVGILALSSRRANVDARLRRAWIALLAGGAGVALASLQPFDKYWPLALPGIAVLAASRMPMTHARYGRRWMQLAALALVLAIGYDTVSSLEQARLVDRYERAAEAIESSLPRGATFARFDTQPFLGVFLTQRDASPVAVLDFVIAKTTRQDAILARLERSIRNAAALVDDGALSVDERSVEPAYRELWRLFDRYRSDFPCVSEIAGLTVRYRETVCPPRTD